MYIHFGAKQSRKAYAVFHVLTEDKKVRKETHQTVGVRKRKKTLFTFDFAD